MGLLVALACAVGLAASQAASAPVREAFIGAGFGKSATPPVGRYLTDEGSAFVFDRSTPRALLKFDGNPEIWALKPAAGPRGDVIYRNDLGEEMLRSTRLGGMTVFTQKRPDGSAAAFYGVSPPLHIQQVSLEAFVFRFELASDRATRALQHQVGFETQQDAEPDTAGPIADAALIASQALIDIAARPANRAALAHIGDVLIAQGPHPNVAVRKNVLVVTIDPRQGVFGRPSSALIEHAALTH